MSGRYLPVFRNPLVTYEDIKHGDHPARTSIEEFPSKHTHDDGDHSSITSEDEGEEASNIELFYDLFFVANLTVFTYIHDVTSVETFRQYSGFFAILWFTWYSVSLYDARFASDSLFERSFKALHFAVMIWLASLGPQFSARKDSSYFGYLTLTLMASRLILALQYLELVYVTRGYQPVQAGERRKTPLFIIVGVYTASAMAYLGLYFVPSNTTLGWAWYVIAAIEALLVTTATNYYKLLSSQGSHLADRMCLLTLIILGEGVIGIAKQCQVIAKSPLFTFEISNIINIMCSILVLYLIYMLYFDWAQKHWLAEKQFGFRPQAWTILHFFLHLALVMAVEGINQCIAWRAALVAMHPLDKIWAQFSQVLPVGEDAWTQAYNAYYNVSMTAINGALTAAKDQANTLSAMNLLDDATQAFKILAPPTTNETLAPLATELLYDVSFKAIFAAAGFGDKPKAEKEMTIYRSPVEIDFAEYVPQHDALDKKLAGQFEMTFIYLFVCVGLAIVLCSGIAALSTRSKTVLHRIRLACSAVIGLVIAGVSAFAAGETPFYKTFTSGPWVLPSILGLMSLITVLNNVKLSIPHHMNSLKRGNSRRKVSM